MAGNYPATTKGKPLKQPLDEIVEHEPEGGRYPMTGGPVPKSSQIQMWANEKNISLEVIENGKNSTEAWAKVRAIVQETGQFVESRVILRYEDVEQRKMITEVNKILKEAPRKKGPTPTLKDLAEPLLISEDGRVVANYTERGLMKFMTDMVNYRYTAERTAETMASRRAEWKILNKEWKDKEEMEGEYLEDYQEEQEISKPSPVNDKKKMEKPNQGSQKEVKKQENPKQNTEEKKKKVKKQQTNTDVETTKQSTKKDNENKESEDNLNEKEINNLGSTELVDKLIKKMEDKGETPTKQLLNKKLVQCRKKKIITPAKFRICRDYLFSLDM